MEEYPVIIYQTIYYEDLLKGMTDADKKTQVIMEILQEGAYEEVFRNGHYAVCLPGPNIGGNISSNNGKNNWKNIKKIKINTWKMGESMLQCQIVIY